MDLEWKFNYPCWAIFENVHYNPYHKPQLFFDMVSYNVLKQLLMFDIDPIMVRPLPYGQSSKQLS
jgi:hypothetical protein